MVDFLISVLEQFGIEYDKIEEPIKNSSETTFPIIIKNDCIYVKVLPLKKIEAIKKEMEIVKILDQNNIRVQKYYDFNDGIPYNENYCLYATYNAGTFYNLKEIDKQFIINCIKNIANMHNSLNSMAINNSPFSVESDFERFIQFYNQNKSFFIKYNLENYIKDLKKTKYDFDDLIFIHSDLNFNNITKNGTIIDFTDLKIGFKEDDLGKFYQNILNTKYNTLNDLNYFIEYYQKISNQKVKMDELILSIIYRLIFRFYNSLNENNNEDVLFNYKKLIDDINKIKEWEQTYDKRSSLQNN